MIASAAVASVASQTAHSMVMHEGNLKEVSKDLTSSQFAKSLMIGVASAGILQGLKGPLDLPPQPRGFEQHVKVNAVRSAVSAGLNMTIGGMKPEDALVSATRMIVAGTLGGLGANEIAEVYRDGQLDYLTHKLTHALLGAGLGAILSEDIPKGMLSGALSAALAETVAEALPKEMTRELRADVGKIGAALGASFMGQELATGIFTACNALENNFMTQEDDLLQRKKREEEELAQVLGYLSPLNQAKSGFMRDLIAEEHAADASSSAVRKMTRKVADYSRQCKDSLKEFAEGYPRITAMGLKTLKGAGMAGEAMLVIGACAGPQSPFLCWGTLGFVAANHSGLTGKAFHQLNRGFAWGLEQGGARPYDAQEVAPWLSGGALMLAGSTKALNLGFLNRPVSLRSPVSAPSLETGSYFPYQAKAYLREIEQITGRPLHTEQRLLLKQSLQEKPYVKLNLQASEKHRDLFDSHRLKLIKKWEEKTGDTWPTYKYDIKGKEGKIVKRAGSKYDAHEIIPNEYGGPLTWYNIHPARFPDQHQAGIHGKNSVLTKLLIQLESK